MQQIIECVPNFSEGRRLAVVEQIVAAITSVPGIALLDRQMDADHNRSVVTFAGDGAAVAEAAFRGCACAAALIDLDHQRGAHPRMGATDVIPFIPIRGATTADCVALARRLGERVGRELGIPVYLYEDAATRETNRNLADVRRGEYEGLKRAIENDPARRPDFGPPRLGTAGAVAIGARFPLIAFNINLAASDVRVARAVARAVRASSGGLPFVKALGLALPGRGLVQVSMNLTNYTQTSLFRAFEAVQREAERHGVSILDSELVGLVPAAALRDSASSPAEQAPLRPDPGPFVERPEGDTLDHLPAPAAVNAAAQPSQTDALGPLPTQAQLDAAASRLRLASLSRDQVLELRLADVLQGSDRSKHLPPTGDPSTAATALPADANPSPSATGTLAASSSRSAPIPPTAGDSSNAPTGDPPNAAAALPTGDPFTTAAALSTGDSSPRAAGAMAASNSQSASIPPTASDFLAALAAATAAPAGGSAAAYAGAMAASLVMMVAGLTLAKKSYAAAHPAMQAIYAEAARLQAALSAAVGEDAHAYTAVMDAYKLPKSSRERAPAIQLAMRGATGASLQVAEQAARVLALARRVRIEGLKTARSDSAVAAYLAEASARGALLNARENAAALADDSAARDCLARIRTIEEGLAEGPS